MAQIATLTTGDYVKDFTIRYLPGVSHWVQRTAWGGECDDQRLHRGETVPEYQP